MLYRYRVKITIAFSKPTPPIFRRDVEALSPDNAELAVIFMENLRHLDAIKMTHQEFNLEILLRFEIYWA